jgi:hypothetical protein
MKKTWCALLALGIALSAAIAAEADGYWSIVLEYNIVNGKGKVIEKIKPDVRQMITDGDRFVVVWSDGHQDDPDYDFEGRYQEVQYYIPGYKRNDIITRPKGVYTILEYPVPDGYEAADPGPVTVNYVNDSYNSVCQVYIKKSGELPNLVTIPSPFDVKMTLNGKQISLNLPVLNQNGRTLYPFRECLELLGAKVSWNDNNRTAYGSTSGVLLGFPVGGGYYYLNYEMIRMEDGVKTIIYGDRTYIPIRYAAEALGYTVAWDAASNTMSLSK